MHTTAVLVFAVVYLGMLLGELPKLQLDRTGVALLGALVLMITGVVTLEEASDAVHLPTLALLFGMMVLSAQLRLGGFYTAITDRLERAPLSAPALLAALIGLVGLLSAVFTNDIVCLATAPVIIAGCRERGLAPIPFLLGLACAANVGSAATLIGNPQNMLVGQVRGLSFSAYLAVAFVPSALGLAATWLVIALRYRGRWTTDPRPGAAAGSPDRPPFDRWQTTKGLVLAGVALLAFLVLPWPRELVALGAAALVLTSRRFHSSQTLGLVDWELLVLFVGLFVVNHALLETGLVREAVAGLARQGVDLERPGWLFAATVVLSNTVSNVPAVMLLLPVAAAPIDGPLLALASTLAGNLLIVGSIASIIVVEQAAGEGIVIDWRTHARVGVPVTLLTLVIAGGTLWIAGG